MNLPALSGPALRRRSFPVRHLTLALAAALLVAALPALAQERDTGRHKAPVPKPAPKPAGTKAAPVADPVFTAGGERWFVGLGAGMLDAGDLYRVQADHPLAWGRDGDTWFTASRFTATVDPGSVITAFAGRRLGQGRWWLRGELATGACDVTAEALLGEGGAVFPCDRVSFLTGTLALEARLTAYPSHPYASFGATLSDLSADQDPQLDQTLLGARGALGYRQLMGPLQLTGEVSLRRMSLDLDGFTPPTSGVYATFDPATELWLFELRLAAAAGW